jgi:vacuolar-type H+-ATPase subunit B/Vma2
MRFDTKKKLPCDITRKVITLKRVIPRSVTRYCPTLRAVTRYYAKTQGVKSFPGKLYTSY